MRNQVGMAFQGIRRKVGVVDAVMARRVVDREHLAIEGCIDAAPVCAVVRTARPVVLKAFGITGIAGVLDAEPKRAPPRTGDPKVEPLEVIFASVLADGKTDGGGVALINDLDVSRVETAADVQGWRGTLA